MRRYIVSLVLVILLLSIGNTLCEEISKCSPELEYLYNYYYDQDALKVKPKQPIAPDSFDTISNDVSTEKLTHPAGDSSLLDSNISVSTVSFSNMPESSIAKLQVEEQPKSITALSAYELTGIDPLNNASLRFEGDIPYLSVMIEYTGDGTDLDVLGVIHGPIYGDIIIVLFPLSILPQVTALQTVVMIYKGGKVELNSVESK